MPSKIHDFYFKINSGQMDHYNFPLFSASGSGCGYDNIYYKMKVKPDAE